MIQTSENNFPVCLDKDVTCCACSCISLGLESGRKRKSIGRKGGQTVFVFFNFWIDILIFMHFWRLDSGTRSEKYWELGGRTAFPMDRKLENCPNLVLEAILLFTRQDDYLLCRD